MEVKHFTMAVTPVPFTEIPVGTFFKEGTDISFKVAPNKVFKVNAKNATVFGTKTKPQDRPVHEILTVGICGHGNGGSK